MSETTQTIRPRGLDRDLVYAAAEVIVRSQLGWTSMLQDALQVDRPTAQHLMETLAGLHVVGPAQTDLPRQVLVTDVDDLDTVLAAPEADVIDFPTPSAPATPIDEPAAAPQIDLTKPELPTTAPAPTAAQATAVAPAQTAPAPVEPAASTPSEPIEGRIIPAGSRYELGEDPEGDRPWIDPRWKTPEGRSSIATYHKRQTKRRLRRLAARQTTPHGVLQRARRGERRVWTWVKGIEGLKAEADMNLALAMTREADKSARRAQLTLLPKERKTRQEVARLAQQQAGQAVAVASSAKKKARRGKLVRAAIAYLPTTAADLLAAGVEGVGGFLGAVTLNVVVLSLLGRNVELTDDQAERLEQIEAGIPQRFEGGMTPRMFETMIRQALTEDLKVNISNLRVMPHAWGFEVHLALYNMTPKKISDNLDLLEACLPGVRTNSILLQQSAASRNECVARIPGDNPWQAVPALPYRAPKSVTTAEIHTEQIGADMSARPLALPMCRTSVNIVGKSRSGKSTLLRSILDVLTATDDQIIIGIDLGSAGSGFGGYRHAMHVVATTAEDAYYALQWALAIGKGRPALFDQLGMGENWVTSSKRPGIKIIVDEFPALVRESRRGRYDADLEKVVPWGLDTMLAELFVTSAKSDDTLVIAGQGVTKEKIKDNTWVVELPVQVMCACDNDDVVQILAGGAMAEGWRPDRLLPAMGDQLNDASVAYVMAGATYCEPIPYRGCYADVDELVRRGRERAAAGLVDIDPESAALSPIKLEDLMATSRAALYPAAPTDTSLPQLITTIREIFTAASDPAGFSQEDLAERLAAVDPGRWSLDLFDGDDETERTAARVEALRTAITAVLQPLGQTWPLEKYSAKLPRGYRLRDLKTITGEDT